MQRRNSGIVILAVLIISGVLLGIFLLSMHQSEMLPHEMVCQLTGEDAVNDTRSVDVYGTDLGIVVHHNSRLHFVFGDTFGIGGLGGDNWRSNTMAYTLDTDPSNGLSLTGWIADSMTGYAKELISSLKVDGVEKTTIPTAAYSDGDCLYIYYMSVKHWSDVGGMWTCNNASIAYSLDGQNFFKATNISWPGTSNFIEFGIINKGATLLAPNEPLYLLATASGRYESAYLACVPRDQLLNQSSYSYYTGTGLDNNPVWSSAYSDAQPIIEGAIGEITVMWNPYLSQYVAMNFDNVELQILLRTSEHPWGPWSAPYIVVTANEHPGLYAPNIHPQLVEDNGRILYFTMSLWDEYNVFLMKVDLNQLNGINFRSSHNSFFFTLTSTLFSVSLPLIIRSALNQKIAIFSQKFFSNIF